MDKEIHKFLLANLSDAQPYREGLKSRCPFHSENTGSFFIYFADSKGYSGWFFKCHGCDVAGRLQTLLKKLSAPAMFVEFMRKTNAIRTVGPVTEDVEYKPDNTIGYLEDYTYFQQRGVCDEISKRFSFKMDFRGPAAIFPVLFNHKYCGFLRRNLDPTLPKYIFADDLRADTSLWGFDDACSVGGTNGKPVLITEGILDAACWWSIGIPAVALLGNKWKNKLDSLRKLSRPYCLPDNGDPNSLKTFYELSIALCCPMYFIPPEFKDTSEWFTYQESLPV